MTLLDKWWAQLRIRLIIVFAAIALITYLLSGLSLYRSLDSRLVALREEELQQRTREFQGNIEALLNEGEPLETAVNYFHSLPASAGYRVVFFNTGQDIVGRAFPDMLNGELTDSSDLEWYQTTIIKNTPRIMYYSVPFYHQEEIAGTLVVYTSLTNIDNALTDLYPQLYVALVFSLVAIAGAGIFIGSNISRVLREIENVSQAIAQGEFDRRVEVHSTDEVGRLAQTINEMAAQLSTLSQAQAQFLSKVSHELRTPLTIVKGFAITILRSADLDMEKQRQIDIINQQTDNLTRLVDDLLDLSRIDVNQLTLIKQPTNLVTVVQSVMDAYEVLAQEKQIALYFYAEADQLQALVDEQRINQVCTILLDNAFKHAIASDVVSVTLTHDDAQVMIVVEDSGPGIPPEDLPHVFERFYQSASAQEGMGLGLSLARELIYAHGGEIYVHNRQPKGCCFTIALPLYAVPEEADLVELAAVTVAL